MNMQMKLFSYRNTGWKILPNCITDYIKTGNISGLKMFLGWNMFIYGFLWLIFKVFINIH